MTVLALFSLLETIKLNVNIFEIVIILNRFACQIQRGPIMYNYHKYAGPLRFIDYDTLLLTTHMNHVLMAIHSKCGCIYNDYKTLDHLYILIIWMIQRLKL